MRRKMAISLFLALTQAAELHFNTQPKEKVMARLGQVEAGTERRSQVIEKLFLEAGCAAGLTFQEVKAAKSRNVLCTLPGESGSVILLGAHFDGVYKGQAAADNWSGASLLSSLYEDIRSQSRKHRFIFIAFTGEEQGLLGSERYVRSLGKEERSEIRAMVNVDTLGLSDTKIWVSRADPKLAQTFFMVARALKLPAAGMNADGAGDSDSRPFVDRKIPVIDVHSVTRETLPILHSKRDTLGSIDKDAYYKSYMLLSAYLVLLDQKLE